MAIFNALGGALLYGLNVSDEQFDRRCPEMIQFAVDKYAKTADMLGVIHGHSNDGEDDVVQFYDLTFINTFMCTDVCPCKSVPAQHEWLSLTEEELAEWPKQIEDPRVAKKLKFNFNGTHTTYLQCIEEVSDPITTLKDSSSSSEYQNCISTLEATLAINPFDIDQAFLQSCSETIQREASQVDADRLVLETIFYTAARYIREHESFATITDWMTFFERELNCAGVCKLSLFSWTKSIEAGRPTKTCLNGIRDELRSNFIGFAVCSLITGVLLLLIFLCQYCLWRRHRDLFHQRRRLFVFGRGLVTRPANSGKQQSSSSATARTQPQIHKGGTSAIGGGSAFRKDF